MPMFHVSDESGHRESYRAVSAERAARKYVLSGDWNDERPGTQVHSVFVRQGREERGAQHLVTYEVAPPKCERNAGRHSYGASEAFGGENGGVCTRDVCRFCGLERTHQTHGQDRSTGRTVPGGVTTYRTAAERE